MIRDKLTTALEQAIIHEDKQRSAMIRLMQATIKDRDIANQQEGFELDDEERLQCLLQQMIKQREESINIFMEAGQNNLAQNEQKEIDIIKEFLPIQMSDKNIFAAVEEAIAATEATGLRDIGRIISWLKDEYNGSIDFLKANNYIRDCLSQRD